MAFPVIHIPFLPVDGMAVFPFILVKKEEYSKDHVLIRHETIHLVQQLELLIIPFYLLYLLHYLFNLITYRDHHKAYLNIVFEREAYLMECRKEYLAKRKLWQWRKFIFSETENKF